MGKHTTGGYTHARGVVRKRRRQRNDERRGSAERAHAPNCIATVHIIPTRLIVASIVR